MAGTQERPQLSGETPQPEREQVKYRHTVAMLIRSKERYLRELKPCDIPAVCHTLEEGYKKNLQGKALEESDYYNDSLMTDQGREMIDRNAIDYVIEREGLRGIAGIMDPKYKKTYMDFLENNHPSDSGDEYDRIFLRNSRLVLAKYEPIMVTVEVWSEATKHYALYSGLAVEKSKLESRKAQLIFPETGMNQSESDKKQLASINYKIRQISELQGLLEMKIDNPRSS